MVAPASSFFSFGNKKESARAGFGDWGGGRSFGLLYSPGTPPPAWQSGPDHCPRAGTTPQALNWAFSFPAVSGTPAELTVLPLGTWWLDTTPRESKNVKTIFFVMVAWNFESIGPGTPFSGHCLDCCLVLVVCMDTADSSTVMIRSRMDSPHSTSAQWEPERSASDRWTPVLEQ